MRPPSLRTLYTILFLLGLFFIPFNSYRGIPVLGEYSRESATLFFLLGTAVLGIDILITKSIAFPVKNGVFCAVLFFLFWCFFTTFLNMGAVSHYLYKGLTGVERFFRQYVSLLIIGFFFLVFFINVLSRLSATTILKQVRRIFLFSLIVVAFYGALETLIVVFGLAQLKPVLLYFNYFPFTEVHFSGDRISGVSFETPFLAIYLITICGWMLSYIITGKGIWRFIPALLVLELTFFAGSRTGLVVISLQYLIFFGVLLFFKKYRKNILYLFSGFALVVGVALVFSGGKLIKEAKAKLDSLNFEQNLLTSISNRSRFGMQYASLQVFKDNPVIGVGFGQLTYEGYKYYPAWAITNNYEFRMNYMNQRRDSFPPSYNLYLRIMAESGLVGLISFLAILILAIYRALKLIREPEGPARILGLITMVSVVGFAFNWLQIDAFRMFGFWLTIAILCIPFREKYLEHPPGYVNNVD
ncbi:MAG TPA: O-antigen ligase family protein [Leeuwenhoekiella sp.]|nr:O-antigen ligase family protein [Leeuwenhoekiella sp.]